MRLLYPAVALVVLGLMFLLPAGDRAVYGVNTGFGKLASAAATITGGPKSPPMQSIARVVVTDKSQTVSD